MRVEKVSYLEWNKLAENAHKIAFQEVRPSWMNTFDFALVCFDEDQIMAYATVIEMDKQTAYMQHGGAMPNVKGTTKTLKTYRAIIDNLKANYKRITTRIENKNVPMLKLAMHEGLLINGCDCYPNEVFLHLKWGFN
jgi:hypothetical protein